MSRKGNRFGSYTDLYEEMVNCYGVEEAKIRWKARVIPALIEYLLNSSRLINQGLK
jgi:hypothetical protein